MRLFDLQRIRREQRVTQAQLAKMTSYPQGFISQIENGKVSCPNALIERVQSVFKIEDITAYVSEVDTRALPAEEPANVDATVATPQEDATQPMLPDLEAIATQSPEQYITMSFLAILQRKEKRIEELEAEVKRLKEELAAVSENK